MCLPCKAGLDIASFDAVDGSVFSFGLIQSGLTTKAGREPLVLFVLLLLTLPVVFK